jgi:hypothetical protein
VTAPNAEAVIAAGVAWAIDRVSRANVESMCYGNEIDDNLTLAEKDLIDALRPFIRTTLEPEP